MEIIERGKIPGERIFRGKCGNCNSVIEAKAAELSITDDQRDGTFGLANCPVCSTDMVFYPKTGGR